MITVHFIIIDKNKALMYVSMNVWYDGMSEKRLQKQSVSKNVNYHKNLINSEFKQAVD